jgi:hypothetical protein
LDEGFFTRLWGAAPVQGIWQVGVKMRKGPIATRPFADRSPTVRRPFADRDKASDDSRDSDACGLLLFQN